MIMELQEHYEIKDDLLDRMDAEGIDRSGLNLLFVFNDPEQAAVEFNQHMAIADRHDLGYTGKIERHSVVVVASTSFYSSH